MAEESAGGDFFDELFPKKQLNEELRNQLREIFEGDPELPSFPAAIAKLQERLNKPQAKLEEIAEIIRLDPGLTARVFSLVKSAAFAGIEVSGIEGALFRLGLQEARAYILSAKLIDHLTDFEAGIDWNDFWVHSLLTARLTDGIVDIFRAVSYKEYVAGLLHDVGKLIFARYFPEEFDAVVKETIDSKQPMYKVEREVWGTDHAAVGAALCHKWGLHQEIVTAVRFHHNPILSDRKDQMFTYSLYVASLISNRIAENISKKKEEEEEKQEPDPNDLTYQPPPPTPNRLDKNPEWGRLDDFKPRKPPDLWVLEEMKKAQETVKVLLEAYTGTIPESSPDRAQSWG